MDNVNNLNGVPNFGHGVVPTSSEQASLDEVVVGTDTEEVKEKPHKAKIRSAAQKALGGIY